MSWGISAGGHIQTGEGTTRDKEVEQELLDMINEFVSSLPEDAGISYFYFDRQYIGRNDLLKERGENEDA